MTNVDFGRRVELRPGHPASVWESGWFLCAAFHQPDTGDRYHIVVAAHPDGRRERVRFEALDGFGTHADVYAFRVEVEPVPARAGRRRMGLPRVVRRVPAGVAFAQRYAGPTLLLAVDPLRVLDRPPVEGEYTLVFASSKQSVGDLIVDTQAGYSQRAKSPWVTNAHERRLADAFEAAGRHGFVVFNRATGGVRPFDLGRPVARVELSPCGLFAAAIVTGGGIVFIDMGDD